MLWHVHRSSMKHTLTYVEALLTTCNQQLEAWNHKLRKVISAKIDVVSIVLSFCAHVQQSCILAPPHPIAQQKETKEKETPKLRLQFVCIYFIQMYGIFHCLTSILNHNNKN